MTPHGRTGALLLALTVAFGLCAAVFNQRMTSRPLPSPRTAVAHPGVRCPTGLLAADMDAVQQARPIRFSRGEQVLICVTSFGVKPVYELLALAIVIAIWRKKETHWRSLRWGLLAFFLGENACAVNYLFYGLTSFAWEFWHCYGMLVAMGLISYAALEFVDQHMVHYGQEDRPCCFLDLCRRCYKHQPVPCNAWLLFVFALPAMMVLCFMPLTASFRDFSCIGNVFGSDVLFSHSRLQQFYEIRVYPVLALVLFAASWLALCTGRERGLPVSRLLFAAALGPFGFCMLRFMLFWSYADNILWAEVWEEISEFLTVLAVLVLLNAKRINGWLRPAGAVAPSGG